MAETIGFLREDATYGEKQVLKLLQQNLPKEYNVYVETPLRKKRELRYPDFIVLTNYGVIVIEVKDWVTIERANPHGADIRTRNGDTRWEHNPVDTAREFALILSNELNTKRNQGHPGEAIPWSYLAVLPNQPSSTITQLRRVWGEEFVIGHADLENPDVLLNRIKMTFPAKRMRPLTRQELDLIRATIYPAVEIEVANRPTFILDDQQEKIVAEPVKLTPETPSKKARLAQEKRRQEKLFESLQTEAEEDTLPEAGKRISQNVSIRLVRGFSGSGKTLVLIQRARFLEAQYPDWKIGVLTFNKPLQEQLADNFRGTSIQPRTFHSLCMRMLNLSDAGECRLKDWLDGQRLGFSIVRKLGSELVEREINWLRDIGITNREDYLGIERKGIGKDGRLSAEERKAIYDVHEAYREHLKRNNSWDWGEVPLLALESIERNGVKESEQFDAVLVDEAQDWAPVWFKVLNHLVHPDHGLVFLADDPSQSIYRFFSWKEKSIPVVGRTRWLRVPYRNTYEIYRAAYSMIASYAEIQHSLTEEGEVVAPDVSSETMRHGPVPIISHCRNVSEELLRIKSTVTMLCLDGYSEKQIAVLVRYRKDMEPIIKALQGTGVGVYMIHSFKGLEMEAVIIPHLQTTFANREDETSERRLLYMAMSRARSQLCMTYSGRLSMAYDDLRKQGLVEIVE